MKKLTFHPFDIKQHGAHMGVIKRDNVKIMPYDLVDDVYTNEQPIKTCSVKDVKWIDEKESFVVILDHDVVVEPEFKSIGLLCLIVPHEKANEILRPIEELL